MNYRLTISTALLFAVAFSFGCDQTPNGQNIRQNTVSPQVAVAIKQQEPDEMLQVDWKPVQTEEESPTEPSTAPLVPFTSQTSQEATVEKEASVQPQAAPFQPQPINICSFNVQFFGNSKNATMRL